MKLDYQTPVAALGGAEFSLEGLQGRVLLIVNTASKCGLTPQYTGLEALHQAHSEAGLSVLGFPCNQFGAQEPGSADDIESFCTINYGVTFQMLDKVDVNGDDTHPLFASLKQAAPGALGTKGIKWNFTKFLVARDGTILRRYAPTTEPAKIEADIRAQLDG